MCVLALGLDDTELLGIARTLERPWGVWDWAVTAFGAGGRSAGRPEAWRARPAATPRA